MIVYYPGHSCFLLRTAAGVTVCFDPYRPLSYEGAFAYLPIEEHVDVVLVSHDHDDHNGADLLAGHPLNVRGACRVRDMEVDVFPGDHDAQGGRLRGDNRMMLLHADGMRILHCGDLGTMPDDDVVGALAGVDIVMVPIGGTYTLDAVGANQLVERLRPRLAIPMHYDTPAIGFPLDGVEPFLEGKPGVRHVDAAGSAEGWTLSADLLPEPTTVLHIEPSHVPQAEE